MKDLELPLRWLDSSRPVKSSDLARMELAHEQPATAKQSSSSGNSLFSKPKSKHSSRAARNSVSAARSASTSSISGQSVFAPKQFIDKVDFLDINFARSEELQTFMKAFEDAAAESGGKRDSASTARPPLTAADHSEGISPCKMSLYTSSTAYTASTTFTSSSSASVNLAHRSRAPSMTEDIDEMDFALPSPDPGCQGKFDRLEQNYIPPRQQEPQRRPPVLELPPTTATGLVPRDAVVSDDEYPTSPSFGIVMEHLTPSTPSILLGHRYGIALGNS